MAAAVVKDGVYVIKSMGTGYCLTEDSNTNEGELPCLGIFSIYILAEYLRCSKFFTVYTGEGCFGIPEGTLGPEYLVSLL